MTDFGISWTLSRQRFVDEIAGLNDEQLNWKPYDGALSIGQMALHVSGVEVSFSKQLTGAPFSDHETRIRTAATDGVVNDKPFPFAPHEITAELVSDVMATARNLAEPLLTDPSQEILDKELQSALGPIITGKGALARFAFHPAYHQGQAYTYKSSPNFPKPSRAN